MDETDSCGPTTEPSHELRLIARSAMGHVVQCGCGHLHLNLQVLTLRFEPDAFRELAALLVFAQRRLDADPRLGTTEPAAPQDAGGAIH